MTILSTTAFLIFCICLISIIKIVKITKKIKLSEEKDNLIKQKRIYTCLSIGSFIIFLTIFIILIFLISYKGG